MERTRPLPGPLHRTTSTTSTRSTPPPRPAPTTSPPGSRPSCAPGFGLTELVASWNADTPGGSWVEVSVRGTQRRRGHQGVRPGSLVPLRPRPRRWHPPHVGRRPGRHRRHGLHRHPGDPLGARPRRLAARRPADASHGHAARHPGSGRSGRWPRPCPTRRGCRAAPTAAPAARVLDVPTFSQEMHVGHFPQWDNGGEAWCSPTSTSMVVAYWGAGPRRDETAWVTEALPVRDRPAGRLHRAQRLRLHLRRRRQLAVQHRVCRDAPRTAGFVTRLRIADRGRGVHRRRHPARHVRLVQEGRAGRCAATARTATSWSSSASPASGDVVCNDPASHLVASNDQVRVVYDREQFENVWVPHSGGIVYVIRPASRPACRRRPATSPTGDAGARRDVSTRTVSGRGPTAGRGR